jgi:bifunctional non-homologous end joining protein LigD
MVVSKSILEKAVRAAFPSGIKPMLATLTKQPFNNQDWVYEVKWDGRKRSGSREITGIIHALKIG